MKQTILFLDDRRNPYLDPLYPFLGSDTKIEWVRNYDEFVSYFLNNNPRPDYISFDHDLHDEHYTEKIYWDDYDQSRKIQEERYPKYKHKTGLHCLEWLINTFDTNCWELPTLMFHTANPVGRDFMLEAIKKAGHSL